MGTWKIGGSSLPSAAKDNIDAPRIYRERGLSAFEMATTQNIKFSESSINTINENAKKYDIAIGFHGKFSSQIMSLPNKTIEELDRGLGTSIYYAGKFNAPVVMHPGGNVWGNYVDQTQLLINRVQYFLNYYSVSPSLIYLETTGKIKEFGHFPELVVASWAMGTRIAVDWAHLYARSMAKFGEFNEYQVDFIINNLENMSWKDEQYFHISGIEYNTGGESKHVPLEDSTIPWFMILSKIKKSSLSGRIILESNAETSRDALIVREFMRDSYSPY